MEISRRNLLRSAGAGAVAIAGSGAGCVRPALVDPQHPAATTVIGPGGWCWFQSPRAVIDGRGELWIGSSQGSGAPTPGSVDVTRVDLRTQRVMVRHRLAVDRVDDHTSPSVLAVPGGVQVGWAPHRRVDWLEIGEAGGPLRRITRPGALTEPGRGTSYVSAHLVAGQRWVLYRGESFSWNLLTSVDGTSWTARGLVVAPGVSGHRPYVHAASDGERLHLVVSDGNPSEFRGTGIWCGAIAPDLTIATASGRTIGRVGTAAVQPRALSALFTGRRGADEAADTDGWTCDLQIAHRRPTAILSQRDPWPPEATRISRWRHRYLWARQRGDGRWTVEHLAWAGGELYDRQPDYTGLAVVDPADPTRVVASTNVHPATAIPLVSEVDGLVHHELFEGRRQGEGQWTWRAITEHSSVDNLRPVLVHGAGRSVTAWMRGTYRAWNDFDTDIVARIA